MTSIYPFFIFVVIVVVALVDGQELKCRRQTFVDGEIGNPKNWTKCAPTELFCQVFITENMLDDNFEKVDFKISKMYQNIIYSRV